LAKRNEIVDKNEKKIEWGYAEAIAFGTLLDQGLNVRLSGQDVERGTFSHRHSVLHGTETNQKLVPLNNLFEHQGKYQVYNSLLSEFAVLGFEFGYSSMSPQTLVLWEAQFGDFSNGAQIIIDQFISASESKWGQTTSVVMLLPHGFEGQGPEHSSARIERYLQLCAEDNMQVVNCTTPAQYFHVLRRQMRRNYRAPLVIFTPKSLLRAPRATSKPVEFTEGRFQTVLPDRAAERTPDAVKRVLICSGKVYYELLEERERRFGSEGVGEVAIVRLEQLYPFDADALRTALAPYASAPHFTWVQEEPRNMGAW